MNVPGVSFDVTVHTGDVYFMMSRWASFPGFSTCNNNEIQLRGMKSGHACGPRLELQASRIEPQYDETPVSAQVHLCNKDSGSGDGSTRLGYVGLFGGYSCAVYTIEAQLLATIDDCSVATKGRCPRNMDKLLPGSGVWNGHEEHEKH